MGLFEKFKKKDKDMHSAADKEKKEDVKYYYSKAYVAIRTGQNFSTLKEYVETCPECVRYSDGGTLLHAAACKGTVEMIEYLVQKGSEINRIEKEWTPLCWAISMGNVANAKILIELGADINSKNSINSPVLLAISNSSEILELLIAHGADITYQYKDKENPWWDALSYAQYYQKNEALEILKKNLR